MEFTTAGIAAELRRRIRLLEAAEHDLTLRKQIKRMCALDPKFFFDNFCYTFDPRLVSRKLPAYLPFILFPRQRELVDFLHGSVALSEERLVEKSRDVGWTWVAAGYSVVQWLFTDGHKTTFGSRKEDYVDKKGDPDSILEKCRLIMNRLPHWMMPEGFVKSAHDNFMRIINPANGNLISGEGGDNIGRGGRSTLYVLDEGAFIERAESVDAAVIANADARVWASSANGVGNVFYRKRMSGDIPVFRFHWRDDPRKDLEWAKKKKKELASSPTKWESEYDIDYAASVEGTIISGAWVQSSIALHKLLKQRRNVGKVAGLDVGAGKAFSVLVSRCGPMVDMPKKWQEVDNIQTTYNALEESTLRGVKYLFYDSVGVGNTVTSTLKSANTGDMIVQGVNVGIPPTDAIMSDDRTADQWFRNLKAQLWWKLRDAFKAAHEYYLFLIGDPEGVPHDEGDLIAIPPGATELAAQVSTPKWFRNDKGLIMIETKDQLAKRGVRSPDEAEALVLSYSEPPVLYMGTI